MTTPAIPAPRYRPLAGCSDRAAALAARHPLGAEHLDGRGDGVASRLDVRAHVRRESEQAPSQGRRPRAQGPEVRGVREARGGHD